MPNDVTSKLKVLQSPFKSSGIYSQNVWDMQLFNNRIYIGQGNSSNTGPAVNAGPIPVNYLDLSTETIVNEYTVNEEQIERFRIINGKLYIPGHDSKESWDLGNYYVLEKNGWTKYRNIPNGIHVYDMIGYKGMLFAALGTDTGYANIVVSMDNGITWRPVYKGSYSGGGRTYNLFEFEGDLYAAGSVATTFQKLPNDNFLLKKWDGSKFVAVPNSATSGCMTLFPQIGSFAYKLDKITNCMGKLIYIVGVEYNDHQLMPINTYTLHTMKPPPYKLDLTCSPLKEPAFTGIPQITTGEIYTVDILDRGNKAYMLTIQKALSGYNTMVIESTDCVMWTEKFRFTNETFARSFEEVNGAFYFGMGSWISPLPKSTGSIMIYKPQTGPVPAIPT